MTVHKLNERLEQLERAYMAALCGREGASVSVLTLLPAIFRAVPGTTVEEVIAALRWSESRRR
jgi:hypothetical protein